MDINQLKVVAGYKVVESKRSKNSKLKLLTVIETETCEYRIMSFIMDEKLPTKVSKISESLIQDRFNNYQYEYLREFDPLTLTVLIFGAAIVGKALMRAYYTLLVFLFAKAGLKAAKAAYPVVKHLISQLDSSYRKCKMLKDDPKRLSICRLNVKLLGLKSMLRELESNKSKCDQNKENRSSCIKRVDKMINKIKLKIAETEEVLKASKY